MAPEDERDERLYRAPAEAYVRGSKPELSALEGEALLAAGAHAGLKLHRFKRTMGLPRVARALGALKAIGPASLLDIGPGRGVFLWPLLDTFPELAVTVAEPDPSRRAHLGAVRDGGLTRLSVTGADGAALPFGDDAFDVTTVLEVLEHQQDPAPMAREAVRVAQRFVVASTPSKPDENPEHVQLFDGARLTALFEAAGAASVSIDYVLNHIIVVARTR